MACSPCLSPQPQPRPRMATNACRPSKALALRPLQRSMTSTTLGLDLSQPLGQAQSTRSSLDRSRPTRPLGVNPNGEEETSPFPHATASWRPLPHPSAAAACSDRSSAIQHAATIGVSVLWSLDRTSSTAPSGASTPTTSSRLWRARSGLWVSLRWSMASRALLLDW